MSSFNPCYLGNTIRSGDNLDYEDFWAILFQSLLSWKYNQISEFDSNEIIGIAKFQSLLSWKYNQIPKICPNA